MFFRLQIQGYAFALACPHPRHTVDRTSSDPPVIDNLTLACAVLAAKAENRAAAKAYHKERKRKLDEEAEAERVKADLAELDRLRRYLIFGTQARLRR